MGFTASGQVETSGSGTIVALNGAVTAQIPTSSSFAVSVTGSWSATLVFEGSVDGSTFFPVPAYTPFGVDVQSTTSNGNWVIPVGGYLTIRARASAFSSGTISVAWNADSNTNVATVSANLNDGAGVAVPVGQAPMSGSLPVVVASDQTGIPVKLSDATGNNVILGQKAMASSLPVVIASDQSTLSTYDSTRTASVLTNQTLIANGSSSVTLDVGPNHDVGVIIRINGSVTGSSPTLQFTLNDLDQQLGNILSGTSSQVYTSATINTYVLHFTRTGRMQLNWTVTGTTPSFGGVYVTLVSLQNSTLRNSSGVELGTTTTPIQVGDAGGSLTVDDGGGSITVDGTVAATQSTSPWVVNQTQIGGSALTLGQKTSANSIPVVLPSDQIINVATNASSAVTYSSGISNLVSVALSTDIFTLTGSATKIVRVTAFGVSATGSAGANAAISLIKRSAANTGGTSTSPAVVPLDSTSAAGTAVARAYTANPTGLGAAVGTIRTDKLFVSGVVTAGATPILYRFGEASASPVVLRGTAEVLTLNLAGVTVTGGSFNIWIEWTEL